MSIHVTPIPRLTNPSLLVQSGTIAMWHGLIANIPSGWVLCDGANSTPDLRTRFVQGAADGVQAGATGGSATAAPATHSDHTVTPPSAQAAVGTHQHRGLVNMSGTTLWQAPDSFGQGASQSMGGYVALTGSSTAKALGLTDAISGGTPSAHTGSNVNAHSVHSTSDSRPPFYAILYIMKT